MAPLLLLLKLARKNLEWPALQRIAVIHLERSTNPVSSNIVLPFLSTERQEQANTLGRK